uniref:Uncharacterized protein n=1 Tax=Sander lucioperca TaxID=283035 RepID=A0A8D0A1K1_SANLU
MKTPPDRPGITFEVGAQLEARDRHKNWYAATIEKIDYDKERIQVHYRQWSRRHNEWFDWTSAYLRPLERVSLRRRGLNPAIDFFTIRIIFEFQHSFVLACWTDCRFYPAKILRVNKDGETDFNSLSPVQCCRIQIWSFPFYQQPIVKVKGGI